MDVGDESGMGVGDVFGISVGDESGLGVGDVFVGLHSVWHKCW